MLQRLRLQQLSVFKDTTLEFTPGLNVLVGDNGTGKTQVLKLGYMVTRSWAKLLHHNTNLSPRRAGDYFEDRLAGLFRLQDVSQLVRFSQKNSAVVTAHIEGPVPSFVAAGGRTPVMAHVPKALSWEIKVSASENPRARVAVSALPDDIEPGDTPAEGIFIPSKEMVSLFKGLVGLFEQFKDFPLDETYRDLPVSLSTLEPVQSNALLTAVAEEIRADLGGDLKLKNGELIFERADGHLLQSQLMAEGHRKLAMLIYLLRTNLIKPGTTVFWDEPEANLNPRATRMLANALYSLAKQGVQVILATHSLFLLRELEILHLRTPEAQRAPCQFIGLAASKAGVKVSQGPAVWDIEPLLLLDESLRQSDRYMEV